MLKEEMLHNPDRLVGRWVAVIYRATQVRIAEEIKDTGLGYGQFPFLNYVARHDGCFQEEIARELFFDKGTTARALHKLETLGLVRREKSVSDGRKVLVHPTPHGLQVRGRLRAILRDWNETLVRGLSTEETESLLMLLSKVAATSRAEARKAGREINSRSK